MKYESFDPDEYRRQLDEARERRENERKAFLAGAMPGPDLVSWVVPKNGAVPDEVLAEHLAQLRNLVRFTLQYAMGNNASVETNLSAASIAQRMIQTNIALSKAITGTPVPDSKTVRGGKRRKGPQD